MCSWGLFFLLYSHSNYLLKVHIAVNIVPVTLLLLKACFNDGQSETQCFLLHFLGICIPVACLCQIFSGIEIHTFEKFISRILAYTTATHSFCCIDTPSLTFYFLKWAAEETFCVLTLKEDFKGKREKNCYISLYFDLLQWNYKQKKWKNKFNYENVVKSQKNIDISSVYLYRRELN